MANQETSADWCEPLYGKILEGCLRIVPSCFRKGFGMLTFVLLKSSRVLIISSLIDLLSSHACHPTYSLLQHNDVKFLQESIKEAKHDLVFSDSLFCSQDASFTCEQPAIRRAVWPRLTVPACQPVLPLKTTRYIPLS